MTHHCCHACRLRFAAAPAPDLATCGGCGRPLVQAPASRLIGYRLSDGTPPGLRDAVAAVLATPSPPASLS